MACNTQFFTAIFLSSSQIFAGAFPEGYGPPDGFSFEVDDEYPIVQVSHWIRMLNTFEIFRFQTLLIGLFSELKDDILLFDYNVQERVNDFVAAAVSQVSIKWFF